MYKLRVSLEHMQSEPVQHILHSGHCSQIACAHINLTNLAFTILVIRHACVLAYFIWQHPMMAKQVHCAIAGDNTRFRV